MEALFPPVYLNYYINYHSNKVLAKTAWIPAQSQCLKPANREHYAQRLWAEFKL